MTVFLLFFWRLPSFCPSLPLFFVVNSLKCWCVLITLLIVPLYCTHLLTRTETSSTGGDKDRRCFLFFSYQNPVKTRCNYVWFFDLIYCFSPVNLLMFHQCLSPPVSLEDNKSQRSLVVKWRMLILCKNCSEHFILAELLFHQVLWHFPWSSTRLHIHTCPSLPHQPSDQPSQCHKSTSTMSDPPIIEPMCCYFWKVAQHKPWGNRT